MTRREYQECCPVFFYKLKSHYESYIEENYHYRSEEGDI
jgi:hypothetical protein